MRIRFARPFPTYIRYNPQVGVVLEIATPDSTGNRSKVIELFILERCSDYVAKMLEFFREAVAQPDPGVHAEPSASKPPKGLAVQTRGFGAKPRPSSLR